jgi:hypothetical protein
MSALRTGSTTKDLVEKDLIVASCQHRVGQGETPRLAALYFASSSAIACPALLRIPGSLCRQTRPSADPSVTCLQVFAGPIMI